MRSIAPAPNRTWSPSAQQRSRLGVRVALRFCVVLAAFAAVFFLPAGTWKLWQGWAFMAFVFIPIAVAFLALLFVDPRAVERRLESREPEAAQRCILLLSLPVYLVVFIAPGLDHRLGWSTRTVGPVPAWGSLLADAVALAGLLFAFWSIQANRFAARTIRVEPGQTVASGGPYRWVRHPMYAGSILMLLAMPIALGSAIAFPLFLLLIPFFVLRLVNEEKVLSRDLPGYLDFCKRTRFRLVPFVW